MRNALAVGRRKAAYKRFAKQNLGSGRIDFVRFQSNRGGPRAAEGRTGAEGEDGVTVVELK